MTYLLFAFFKEFSSNDFEADDLISVLKRRNAVR